MAISPNSKKRDFIQRLVDLSHTISPRGSLICSCLNSFSLTSSSLQIARRVRRHFTHLPHMKQFCPAFSILPPSNKKRQQTVRLLKSSWLKLYGWKSTPSPGREGNFLLQIITKNQKICAGRGYMTKNKKTSPACRIMKHQEDPVKKLLYSLEKEKQKQSLLHSSDCFPTISRILITWL